MTLDALLPVLILAAVVSRLLRARAARLRRVAPTGRRVILPPPTEPPVVPAAPAAPVARVAPARPPVRRPAAVTLLDEGPASGEPGTPAERVASTASPVARAAARSRRLDVGRDLVAAELLAPPVALRTATGGGPSWR